MNELDSIVEAWNNAVDSRNDGILCTVVEVRGSAYRQPGARMLFFPDGRRVGAISGGCLEGDVCRKAWWLTADGRPVVRVYDSTSDDDAVWEFGLGCNGVVHVLLERGGSAGVAGTMAFVESCHAAKTSGAVATVVRASAASGSAPGDRLFVRDGEEPAGTLAGSPLAKELMPWIELAWHERRGRNVLVEGADVFIEWIEPPQKLFVFGGGHDAMLLVRMAHELGWEVTVGDGRPAYACTQRFPCADHVVLLDGNADIRNLGIDSDSAVLLMTHNYPQDERLLEQIMPLGPTYLGLLGPRKRAERLMSAIGADIRSANLHAPVGLDIGAEEPAAIALSILSEIQAHLTHHAGGKLRHRSGPIHQREPDEIEFDRPVRTVACPL